MGNGNRNGTVMGAGGGCGGDSTGKAAAASFECDVGLGLKVQNTESYPASTKKMTVMPHPSPYHHPHPQQYHHPCHESNNNFLSGGCGSDYGGYGYNSGCGPQLACVSGIYDAVGAATPAPAPASASASAVLPRTLLQSTSSGGGMTSGKVLFTANQWQELERQTTIYKYMMTSTPVPPELLLPFSSSSTRPPPSQSNTAGLDLRFSSGSDPEPWRCRRTDGKKWRCSRDVAPDQKYCERHAHKSRPRSRKPVEIQSHTTTSTAAAAAAATTGNLKTNYTHHPSIVSAYNTNQSFQKASMPQFSNMVSATTYDQPRGTEWFMRSGGTTPVSTTSTQQFQQLMQSSSARLGTKRDKNSSIFQQNYEGEQQHMSFNPYLSTNGTSDTTGSTAASTRQQLIDAWSRGGTERDQGLMNGIGNNYKCSLTLSMQSGGNGIDEDNEIYSMGSSSHVGMIDSDRGEGITSETGEVLKSQTQWLNSGAWIGSAPGGPLGEALCLGIASNGKGTSSNMPSPHHGYSNSTTTSSSCEDGFHGLNFIR